MRQTGGEVLGKPGVLYDDTTGGGNRRRRPMILVEDDADVRERYDRTAKRGGRDSKKGFKLRR